MLPGLRLPSRDTCDRGTMIHKNPLLGSLLVTRIKVKKSEARVETDIFGHVHSAPDPFREDYILWPR